MRELGIYIHIPFCIKKCAYCDFTSFEGMEKNIDQYIDVLKEEINSSKDFNNRDINFKNFNVTTIYIGGGTPSSIDSKYIVQILNLVKQKCEKNPDEITIEVNPGTVTQEKLQDYYKAGINRLSIGLQTTNNKLLNIIGRIHTYEQFEETYKMAREVRI